MRTVSQPLGACQGAGRPGVFPAALGVLGEVGVPVVLRLHVEAAAIPGVAEHYAAVRRSQVLAARAIVRRRIRRGELTAATPVTILLDTLTGGAMMHVLSTPPDLKAGLARDTRTYAGHLVSFLLRAVAVTDLPVAAAPLSQARTSGRHATIKVLVCAAYRVLKGVTHERGHDRPAVDAYPGHGGRIRVVVRGAVRRHRDRGRDGSREPERL